MSDTLGLETIIKRDTHNNWRAVTDHDMGEDRVLRISTYKSGTGDLLTTASVQHRTKQGFLVFAIFKDYNKVLAREKVRCTAKNVEAQHNKALEQFETIKADATRHYAGEPALLG